MHHVHRRISPALIISIAALSAALGGTALAAGEIITSRDQVAEQVIDGLHVKNQSISRLDLKDPHLRVKVNKDATKTGSDASVKRTPGQAKGSYDVTFSTFTLNGGDGTTGDTVLSENCVITATARDTLSDVLVKGPTVQQPNTVTVQTVILRNIPGGTQFQADDNAFDITAAC